MIDVLDWKAISVLIGVALAWSVVLLWSVRVLMDRYQRGADERVTALTDTYKELMENYQEHIDRRLSDLTTTHNNDAKEWRRVDRDLMQLRADLPMQYVMRDDWIRFAAVIDAKQDTLNEKLERLLERKGTAP